MGNTSENNPIKHKKHICIGLLAHVDAGKTTLAEGMLYETGTIRHQGRVDHKDCFLDNDIWERNRGITIFSKQAEMVYKDMGITLFDTPGHVDFSAEMERELAVIDYAVLVINGMDGVQSHTETLWRLLTEYKVPVFIFVNKMDMAASSDHELMENIKHRLDGACVNFSVEKDDTFLENIAVCNEAVMETFLEKGNISDDTIKSLIAKRELMPVYFGSALKLFGVTELLEGIYRYTKEKQYPDEFGARIFKIARDLQGTRLTYMKITGGSLVPRKVIEEISQKVNQIRIYSGAKFNSVDKVTAGGVCAVTGLEGTFAGQGLGIERERVIPIIEPVMTYKLLFDRTDTFSSGKAVDEFTMLQVMKELEEENPELNILWNENAREIHVQIMGQVQLDIIKEQIKARTGVRVDFGHGQIIYKETISEAVLGVGHFEPLKHYSEVHLLMEPLERGNGLYFDTACSEDILDKSWQRLIISHLEEREHIGVLTGSAITDMKITVVAGRAHPKHTEGGDFRQSTYRAVRQGLMMGRNLLLEPIYSFKLEVPVVNIGRAMSDLTRMSADFEQKEITNDVAVIEGRAPVSEMAGYHSELTAYTKGMGRLICTSAGYEVCHNTEQVLESFSYNPEEDMEHPSSSVFCAHGAGYVVPWYQVYQYMHVESDYIKRQQIEDNSKDKITYNRGRKEDAVSSTRDITEELDDIFNRTYGTRENDNRNRWNRGTGRMPGVSYGRAGSGYTSSSDKERTREKLPPAETGLSKPGVFRKAADRKDYLLVDGYNIIFAWDELKELADISLDSARGRLMDILSNYQGYAGCELILVFDAYKVKGNPGEITKYNNIYVVYTREAETADMYIEKTTHQLGRKHKVTVATSDGLEQLIIMGQGALRLSAAGLREQIYNTNKEMSEKYLKE